jgi:ABC-type multidrug transport system fused ATPase/permease subunit
MAAFGIGASFSNIPSINKAKASAKNVFEVIDTKSTLDVRLEHKDQHTVIERGQIDFYNVDFKYPTRDHIVLNKFNMRIPANAKVALVGASGCGKSTITNLILRFYDVLTGHIQIDGVDIRNYNVMALRKQIGFVMQEPVLFDLSIKENILYGNRDAKDSDVYRCAELANALAFIESDIEKRDKASKMKKYKSLLRRALRKCKAKGYPSIAKEIIPDDIAEQG